MAAVVFNCYVRFILHIVKLIPKLVFNVFSVLVSFSCFVYEYDTVIIFFIQFI